MPFLCFLFMTLTMQNTPVQIVQKQLDTYNSRDIEGFMSVMSPNVALYEFGQSTPTAQGADSVRKLYTQLFDKSPQLHSTLIKRMVMGNKVIDHESIVGRNGNLEAIELIVIYELDVKMKINRITVIRP